jgi:hypothetical protein
MEKINEITKDNLDKIIRFMDSISKILEGLKDKYTLLLFENESKNIKPDTILQNWVDAASQIIKEKYEELFEAKYKEDEFNNTLKLWLIKYKDNNEFLLNAKVLLKNLQTIRTTIKNKITESDTLSYVNLTDMLIQKANKK